MRDEDGAEREPEMTTLIREAEHRVTRRRFTDTANLIRETYASLLDVLEHRGALRLTPFEGEI